MRSIFLDIVRILVESFKHPFQNVSILRHQHNPKDVSYGFFGTRGNKDDQEYIQALELQVKNLQMKVDSDKHLKLSATFNGIVIFLCCLTILSWAVLLYLASITADVPSNEAQKALISTCTESSKLLPTALISLLGGKAIR